MGKRNRRKQRNNIIFGYPIRVLNEETGELIEEFVDPQVAKYFNDKIKAGATKEEITEEVTKWVANSLAERAKNAPVDGQHRKDI
jgi:hypothetical protein